MARPQYIGWKGGISGMFKVDAEAAYDEIRAIADANAGRATSEMVVEASRSDNAVLHECFNWDDAEAAHSFRKTQARTLMNSIEVRYAEAPKVTAKAFEVVSTPTRGYRETSVIMSNRDQRAELLERAKRELGTFREKFKTLQELKPVFDALEEVLT